MNKLNNLKICALQRLNTQAIMLSTVTALALSALDATGVIGGTVYPVREAAIIGVFMTGFAVSVINASVITAVIGTCAAWAMYYTLTLFSAVSVAVVVGILWLNMNNHSE